jgi:hypothetical protein
MRQCDELTKAAGNSKIRERIIFGAFVCGIFTLRLFIPKMYIREE